MKFTLFAALLALAADAQSATPACPPLLELRSRDPVAAPLALDQCEVDLKLAAEGPEPLVRLQLDAKAAERWREALKPGEPWWQQMLVARVSLRSSSPSLPGGTLFSSHLARLLPAASWQWNERDASLTLTRASNPEPSVCAKLPPGKPLLWFGTLELAPGSMLLPSVLTTSRPGVVTPVAAECVLRWELSADAPALIHPRRGVGQIRTDAKDGTEFEVTAELAESHVGGTVRVVRPADQPLAGRWKQVAERVCDQPTMQPPRSPIRELVFTGNGEFSVTWEPFEVYKDYWGVYNFEKSTSTLTMQPLGFNFIPANAGIIGKARVTEEGRLDVSGLLFGTRVDPPACQTLFER